MKVIAGLGKRTKIVLNDSPHAFLKEGGGKKEQKEVEYINFNAALILHDYRNGQGKPHRNIKRFRLTIVKTTALSPL